jgi:hypothetical protein
MPQNRSNALAWWSAATIFVSAFLLFQVQPVISKKILPWFGGSPAVWTTCVLFFQLVLLGGYAYAHWLIRSVSPKWQGPIHISVLILALLTFPITASGYWNITPSSFWKPIDGDMPAIRILLLLAAKVAAPFFVASTTGPLVQAWFSQLYPGRSPYRLYSLSNVGSLAALLTYPFFIEPLFRVDTQGVLWSLGFILFAGLIGGLGAIMRREAVATEDAGRASRSPREPLVTAADGLIAKRRGEPERRMAVEPDVKPALPPPASLRIAWLALAGLASMAFLAITNHLSQDIAVVPFMWVIPLSIYLISFIICFDNERWYLRKTFGFLAILGILWMTAMNHYGAVNTGLEYPQKFVRTLFTAAPKVEDALPSGSVLPAPPPVGFWARVKQADPWFRSPFSRSMDWTFKKMGWVVEKIDGVWQWIRKDRRPVALPSGETFATLDKDKNGKLTMEEVPEPALTSFARWDLNSDGSINEEEFNTAVAKRKPLAHLTFEVNTYDFKEHVFAISTAYMLVLFLICMVCHGELVKSKPAPDYLTSFYLSISAGGALGGLFVALLCPLIFKTQFEMPLAIIGGFVVGWTTIFNDGRGTWLKGREILQWTLAFVFVGTALFVVRGNLEDYETQRVARLLPKSWQHALVKWNVIPEPDEDLITIERNFYGTIRVEKTGQDGDPEDAGMSLYNGRIWHGFQYTAEHRQLEPSTYYVSGTGAAMAVEHNLRKGQGLRVAVIGLGSGSMAAHSKKGDTFRFYDIDPKVLKVATEVFTYLKKAPTRGAKIEVVMGDARLSMERELKEHGSMNYDVIHLDAFSGDAIPAHLLTDEAFDLYEQHLRKDESGKSIGIVVVHISNRYLDLEPVVAAIAKKHDYLTRTVHKQEEGGTMDTASDWILVTKNKEFLDQPAVHDNSEPLAPDKELLWTDQYTALYPIMK